MIYDTAFVLKILSSCEESNKESCEDNNDGLLSDNHLDTQYYGFTKDHTPACTINTITMELSINTVS